MLASRIEYHLSVSGGLSRLVLGSDLKLSCHSFLLQTLSMACHGNRGLVVVPLDKLILLYPIPITHQTS